MTDVERSTLLWQEDAAAMSAAIARHDQIVEDVMESYNGRVIKTRGEGDSTFSVFTSSVAASQAAVEPQRALHSEKWQLSRPISVRAALNSGEIEDRSGDCYGPEVNLCARLRGAAHAGQVLATRAVIRDLRDLNEHDHFEVEPLGKHRLKDFAEAVEVYQLGTPGARRSFEPIASLNASVGFLPQFGSQFLCRTRELDELELLLRDRNLVTIVGPGGVGKTRLGVEAARQFTSWTPDGAHFVDFSGVREGDQLQAVIAAAMKLRAEASVSAEALVGELRAKEALLVLDRSEHLMASAVPLVKAILQSCPGIKILVTSRGTLKLTGEQVFRLKPLSAPAANASADEIEHSDAVQFFSSRAKLVRHDFAVTPKNAKSIAAICSQLDGIPAALEMAAVRVRSLTTEQIVARLSNRFKMLGQEGSERSLQALYDWSWESLSAQEQRFAWCAASFEESFDLESAEAICDGFEAAEVAGAPSEIGLSGVQLDPFAAIDHIDSLVEKSLLVAEEADDSMRYRLSSTFREYACDKWADPSARLALQRAHAEHFLERSRTAPPDGIAHDAKNMARAIEFYAAIPAPSETGEMALAMTEYWQSTGLYVDGLSTMTRCLEVCAGTDNETLHARLLNAIGIFEYYLGRFKPAQARLADALEVARRIDDDSLKSKALNNLALVSMAESNPKAAIAFLEEALPLDRAQNDDDQLAISLSNLGYLLTLDGDLVRSKAFLEEALQVTSRTDNKKTAIPCLCNLSDLALEENDLDRSYAYAERGLAYSEEVNNKVGLTCCLLGLGEVELRKGNLDEAEALLRKALARSIDMNAGWIMGSVLDLLAIVFWRKGGMEEATLILVHRQVASSLPSPRRYAREADEIYAAAEVQVGPEALARIRHRAGKGGVASLVDELPRATRA
jgi:predicted ATPase/class 3 adenylate cyclase